jgi:GT2 family glycosyltransferase
MAISEASVRMMGPSLSVIIPAYNVETYIELAVRSALAQTLIDLEVIVVDDGSTDGTAARVAALEDSRLRLVSQGNRGLSGARNTGIRLARGRYVGFLDGDDAWQPERAAMLTEVMEKDPTVGLVSSDYIYLDESGRERGVLRADIPEPTLVQMIQRNYASSGVIGRRDVFVEAGLFDESLRSCEDLEMWVRVLAHTSYKLRIVPKPLAFYRERRGSLTTNYSVFLANADRAMRIIRTHAPQLPEVTFLRGLAECYRIASRKALSVGNLRSARKHLRQALGIYPLLPLIDRRAFGTVCLVGMGSLLPRRWQWLPYWAVTASMRIRSSARWRSACRKLLSVMPQHQ